MVTHETRRRDYAAYALERVIELAGKGKVRYASRVVFRDTDNLGYSPEDVHACLASLQANDFAHSEAYEGNDDWHDVFKIAPMGPAGQRDKLYIKLKLQKDCVVVLLCSFHLER